MNQEKLAIFIQLIDKAIHIAKERKKFLKTQEFYENAKKAGWFTQEEINLGTDYLEQKYDYIFHYKWLDENIIQGLERIKKKAINFEFEEDLKTYPKGSRYGFGKIRGMSEYSDHLFGEGVCNNEIYDSCWAVEKYFNHELE